MMLSGLRWPLASIFEKAGTAHARHVTVVERVAKFIAIPLPAETAVDQTREVDTGEPGSRVGHLFGVAGIVRVALRVEVIVRIEDADIRWSLGVQAVVLVTCQRQEAAAQDIFAVRTIVAAGIGEAAAV